MRRVAALFAAFAAVAFAPAPAWASQPAFSHLKWRSIGPAVAGGRVAAVAGTTADANLYYIGTAGGGVWRSENGGATWTPVFAHEPVSAIGAVAIDPSNEKVVWVGTGEANPRNDVSYGDGVYRSTDGGKTWKNLGLHATWSISRILIDPKNANHVIVGAFGDPFKNSVHRGVYVTFDGGKTWRKTLYAGPESGASDLAMNPDDPSTIYAGIWQFRRKPWTFRSGGPADGLYKSTDGGKTWSKLTGHGLPAGYTGRIGLAVAPSDPSRVYALIEAKGGILWRSDDAGASWKMVSDNTLIDQRPFYFTHLAVDPKNPNHVYTVSEMLAASTDGGYHFKRIAKGVHVDYHAIWIAPNDPKRIIVGEDGGYALTLDAGQHWSFSRNLTIGQIYHIGLSNGNPYTVCAALQDNNAYCGPSNSRNPEGILAGDWQNVIPGDGMWSVPDPADSDIIVSDLENGNIALFYRKAQIFRFVNPYQDFSRNSFYLYKRKYRFNWDAPIAFAPWNPHVLWYGGNVVFQSTDDGVRWTPISPDLTLDIKAHQQPAGGPLVHDVSGAEYSDTILDIEGSPVRRGEIWVGTDDGLVQLTLDGGKHWTNVTPKGLPPYGRVETVAPSPLAAGTAYASFDRHRSGDQSPYLFVTHDYGKTWTKIVDGLPAGQYVRTVRPDVRNRELVYAGTEEGIYVSYDGGRRWQSLKLNLPTVSVRDIRIQPAFDDLAIATHGRDVWILDDIRSLQDLPQAQARGTMLFPIRTAYEYAMHSNNEGLYTRFGGQNPPQGAIVDFYQAKPQSKPPTVEILNSAGRVIRHISGTHTVKGKKVPNVSNVAGINRVVWDFNEDGVTLWMGAARKAYRGPKEGVQAVPGRYSARIVLAGHTYTQSFTVKPDPLTPYTPADFRASYAFAKKYLGVYGTIDTVLNHLDAQKKSLMASRAAFAKRGNAALVAKIDAALGKRDAIFNTFTADYHNDEDSIQRPGALRESIPGGLFLRGAPPTRALLAYARRFDAAYRAALAQYDGYVRSTLVPLSASLKAAGGRPIGGAQAVR
ncbi:MAG: WD40/YVTN/BNR-like repeat-containing protein [Vulcanimicrobiaceae bacterium]